MRDKEALESIKGKVSEEEYQTLERAIGILHSLASEGIDHSHTEADYGEDRPCLVIKHYYKTRHWAKAEGINKWAEENGFIIHKEERD